MIFGVFRRLLAVGVWSALFSTSALAEQYTFTVLTNQDGRQILPTGLNSFDQVVGYGILNEGPQYYQGFLWTNGIISQIDFGDNGQNEPAAINDQGIVVGTYYTSGETSAAFIYDTKSGLAQALTTNPDLWTRGVAINAEGTAVGSSTLITKKSFPVTGFFAKLGGVLHEFSAAPMSYTSASAVNDSGAIIGTYRHVGSTSVTAFLRKNRRFTTVAVPGARSTTPTFIDNDGTIGGFYQSEATNSEVGFIYAAGKYTSITYPAALSTEVVGVSKHGAVFGNFSDPRSGGSVGFVEMNGKFHALRLAGYRQTTIIAVNVNGDFVGTGQDGNRTYAGFVAQCRAASGRCD